MPTYVITGASRGLGYEFLRQFSSASPDSIVIGLVRNVSSTQSKVELDQTIPASSKSNIHVIHADITDIVSLKSAAKEISSFTPHIDYLINNAALVSAASSNKSLFDLGNDQAFLESELMSSFQSNVIGVVNTINTFLPLIQKSQIKKVVSISTGLADDSLTNAYDVWEAAPYSISKAALNTVVAKYNARHGKRDGILFLAISPGLVATGNNTGDATEESEMPGKFKRAYPEFAGPITPETSVTMMRDVFDRASAGNEFAGAFVSHFGDKKWL